MTSSVPARSAPLHAPIAAGNRVLTTYPVALSAELQAITDVFPPERATAPESRMVDVVLGPLVRRLGALRRSWQVFRQSSRYPAVVSVGDLEGLALAALLRLRRQETPVHVMYDCLWYGGGALRRAWMRFCLRGVDCCIVWASIEQERYARAYGIDRKKFAFVPHHHTLKHYQWDSGDDGYIFTGGNADRDFAPFFDAVRGLDLPCVLATNRPKLLRDLDVPGNVRVVSVSPAEFRRLMARSRIVVMPMRATLLHAGAQQSILNAMLMGKPVILTDPEGGADYIDSGRTGILVPYGDPSRLRDGICHLWERPEEAAAMGARAQIAASALTVERSNIEMWNIALDLVRAKREKARGRSTEPMVNRRSPFRVGSA